jgi:hypothetical protein
MSSFINYSRSAPTVKVALTNLANLRLLDKWGSPSETTKRMRERLKMPSFASVKPAGWGRHCPRYQ